MTKFKERLIHLKKHSAMTKKTITKGEGTYSKGSEMVKIDLAQPKKWVDLELWLDIRLKSELIDTITLKVNIDHSITPSLTLTTPNLQTNFGFTENTQELRIPLSYFATEDIIPEDVKNSLMYSLEIEFETEGTVEFYYRIKDSSMELVES